MIEWQLPENPFDPTDWLGVLAHAAWAEFISPEFLGWMLSGRYRDLVADAGYPAHEAEYFVDPAPYRPWAYEWFDPANVAVRLNNGQIYTGPFEDTDAIGRALRLHERMNEALETLWGIWVEPILDLEDHIIRSEN